MGEAVRFAIDDQMDILAGDLPADIAARDAFLLRIMGSPDARQSSPAASL
jgi:hypothetical protein